MKAFQFAILFVILVFMGACTKDEVSKEIDPEVFTVKNTEDFSFDFEISGDEEGATIIVQAEHAEISEIKRDESTNWSVVYHYKPIENFVGTDSVRIELCTSGDGTTCGETTQITFFINVVND